MSQNNPFLRRTLQSGGCFDYIRKRVDDAGQTILSGSEEFFRILSKNAVKQMKSQLLGTLCYLHLDALSRLLLEEVKAQESQEDMLEVLFSAADRLGERLNQTDGSIVYDRYPLLADFEKRIVDHFIISYSLSETNI